MHAIHMLLVSQVKFFQIKMRHQPWFFGIERYFCNTLQIKRLDF